jgi:4-hydroxythreonine-4-phosphate dehydrogenase
LVDVLVQRQINIIFNQMNLSSGHTDYLNQELEGNVNVDGAGYLRVGLLTDHIPLSEVASHLRKN